MFHPDGRQWANRRKAVAAAACRPGFCNLLAKPEMSALCVPALRCPAFAGRPKRQARNNPATPGALKILRSRRGSNYRPAVGVRAGSRVTCKTENAGNVGVVRPGATVSGAPVPARSTAGKLARLALAVSVQRGTAPNRRRSAGARRVFSPGTAYDFKIFLFGHKSTGKRGAVANAHSAYIPA